MPYFTPVMLQPGIRVRATSKDARAFDAIIHDNVRARQHAITFHAYRHVQMKTCPQA